MIGIGSKVWHFNDYRNRGWKEHVISGETSRSWIVGENVWDRQKLSKKDAATDSIRDWAFSEQKMIDVDWTRENRYRISSAIYGVDVATLRKIAELIGYEAKQ